MLCSKCNFQGGRNLWRFSGNANFSGTITFRICPNCGHLESCDEVATDEQYEGPQPWGVNKFRGKVFKGKKTTSKQNS